MQLLKVGFMGPASAPKNPSYEEVCRGVTGHVEVFNLQYSGDDEFYKALVKFFFMFHDPTVLNKQGNDEGKVQNLVNRLNRADSQLLLTISFF